MSKNDEMMKKLKTNMDLYKSKLSDKYCRANSHSKRMIISRELIDFSFLYKELFGSSELLWDNDIKIYDSYDINECHLFRDFVSEINKNDMFYSGLSDSVLNSFYGVDYPFYRYHNGSVLFNSHIDIKIMFEYILDFFKQLDYNDFLDMKEKIANMEVLQIELDSLISGYTFSFSSINKNFILLNKDICDNIYKAETIVHEYGHAYEMQLAQNNGNSILNEKGLATPYYEVSSFFFEYAFLNYLKDNKIHTNCVLQSLDNYYKELISYFFQINLLSKEPDLLIECDGTVKINTPEVIRYGDKIKDRLNYYYFGKYDDAVDFKTPYVYGIGQLLSIYLYENYKENPNFFNDFRKVLAIYPYENDISVFERVGIKKEELLKGDVLKKVLKQHSFDFNNN